MHGLGHDPVAGDGFDRQLDFAGLLDADRPQFSRILDLGCGWGFISYLLARRFPECQCIDSINISPRQLDYCAQYLADHDLSRRVNLYLCDGQDVDLLPSPEHPYDLVVVRGVFTHFLNSVYEASVRALAGRVRTGGIVIVSDTLFKDVDTYTSHIPDTVDRLACGNRKTPEYFAAVIEQNGFTIRDMRVLPSNADVAHWFQSVKSNIDTHFPSGVSGPLQELHVMADNMTEGLVKDHVSAYSIIAQRT
ncbi:SAM-dependent methyltransferase [Streptomyces olivoreticuli]